MGLLDMLGEIIGLKPTPALSKCPHAKGVICIMVRRQGGDGAGIPGVKITLKGPSPGVVVTDSMGIAEFGDRDVGDYKFAADFSNDLRTSSTTRRVSHVSKIFRLRSSSIFRSDSRLGPMPAICRTSNFTARANSSSVSSLRSP